MVAVMGKNKFCCLYAALAALAAVILISLFRGYDFTDWGLITWFGVLAIIVAAFICMKCRSEDEEGQG